MAEVVTDGEIKISWLLHMGLKVKGVKFGFRGFTLPHREMAVASTSMGKPKGGTDWW